MKSSILNLSKLHDSTTSYDPRCGRTIFRRNSDPASSSVMSAGTPRTILNLLPKYSLVLDRPVREYALYVRSNSSTLSMTNCLSSRPFDLAGPTIPSNISLSLVSTRAFSTIITGTKYSLFLHENRKVMFPSVRCSAASSSETSDRAVRTSTGCHTLSMTAHG